MSSHLGVLKSCVAPANRSDQSLAQRLSPPRFVWKFGRLPPLAPPPPASPVTRATTASRAQNAKRTGSKSICFVRTKAGEMDSTADARFRTLHLPVQSLYFYLPSISNKCLGEYRSVTKSPQQAPRTGSPARNPSPVEQRALYLVAP